MERKIGEIFEYNGEWYQCVRSILTCSACEIPRPCTKIRGLGYCSLNMRNDKEQVVFKKLEKVGEPYPLFGRIVQRYSLVAKPVVLFKKPFACYNEINKTIDIELKQDKEDMEEKTQLPKEDNPLTRLVYNYVNGKISDKDLIESIKELPDKYPYTQNLKEFDLEAAKAGKPVCTRDGRKARIICFDRKSETPITVLVTEINGIEAVYSYPNNGIWDSPENTNGCDLMMLPEKKEGWVNVYKDSVYDTKEEALAGKSEIRGYIDTIKISWSE